MYCSNPACSSPENPDSNQFCQGCGQSLLQPPLFRTRYKVIKVLGQGAFGRTYLAEDKDRFDNPCVIKKFIAEGQGNKAKELFEQEGKSLYNLDHPQIPRLQAYFDQDDAMYLVQDYVDGENLLKELLWQGPFSEKKLLEFLRDFLPVLRYIHQQGLLHRDIKPENIMRRRDGRIFLIDFGGVKQHSGTVATSAGTRLYTPGYAAHEQTLGQPRRASDIYSLGATCVRLLTGCLPGFDNQGNIHDELYDIDEAQWVWREKAGRVSSNLAQVLDKMLEHSPKRRYQKVDGIITALDSLNKPPTPPKPRQPKQATTLPPTIQPSIPQKPSRPQIFTRKRFIYGGLAGVWTLTVATVVVNYFLAPSETEVSRQLNPSPDPAIREVNPSPSLSTVPMGELRQMSRPATLLQQGVESRVNLGQVPEGSILQVSQTFPTSSLIRVQVCQLPQRSTPSLTASASPEVEQVQYLLPGTEGLIEGKELQTISTKPSSANNSLGSCTPSQPSPLSPLNGLN